MNESEPGGPEIQAHQVVPLVERQHALIENLRVRDPQVTTARQLAERLGVSTRTVEPAGAHRAPDDRAGSSPAAVATPPGCRGRETARRAGVTTCAAREPPA